MSHTPGPWLVQDECNGDWVVWTRQPHTGHLAVVYGEDVNGDFPAEANARLMASAPDGLILAEDAVPILEALLDYLGGPDEDEILADLLARTRSFIAKARGAA